MAQQIQPTSQFVRGPVNVSGDIDHWINASNTPQSWLDSNALIGGVQGVTNSLQTGPANIPITQTAAATNAFTPVLNLPGNSAYEGVPFKVKASGWISVNGGTYTATIQPLIYASTTLGYTASLAAAVLSTTGVGMTIAIAAAATLTYIPWECEVELYGTTKSGNLGGRIPAGAITIGPASTGTAAVATTSSVPLPSAPQAITNSPQSVNFGTSTPPLQFLVGIVTTGATLSATVATLETFYIES